MLNSEMHLLSGQSGHQSCIRPTYDWYWRRKKNVSPKPTNSLPFSSPPNQLISVQNVVVILTLTVKAILILNKTMLARPEF